MSKVFNMVGGGGGKNISSIIITGLGSTDTVTCTKDGKGYTATWDSTAQHWEIVGLPLGTFTVTATKGTATTTETVLIDIAGIYEIKMFNKPKGALYWFGDECAEITGGWGKTISWYGYEMTQITDGNFAYHQGPGTNLAYTYACTNNKIDMSKYSKIVVEGKLDTQYGYCSMGLQGYSNTSNYGENLILNINTYGKELGSFRLETEITTTPVYLVALGGIWSRDILSEVSGTIEKIWLE